MRLGLAKMAAVGVLALVVATCNAVPSPSFTPTSGQGWALLKTRLGGPVQEGVALAPLGPDAYLVAITVPAGGANGCGTPTFTGFEQSASTLVGKIVRSPLGEAVCAVISTTTFYVELDRLSLPNGVNSVGVSDCADPDCVRPPVPIPSEMPT
jgi:hypothetical protein